MNSYTPRRLGWMLLFFGLVALNVAGRMASEMPNVAPVAASALFAAWLFRNRLAAAAVPLASMLVTDGFWKGFYDLRLMAVVYAALLFPVLLRRVVGARINPWRVGGASLIGSAVFYVTTNFAEWAMMGHYPPTWAGLAQCYAAALPFLKNTVAGDLAWNTALFGAAAAALRVRGARLAARPARA